MIAQQFAIDHPARTRTLTSIMSTTGEADLPPPSDDALTVLMAPAPSERAAFIEHEIAASQVLCSPAYFVEDEWREYHGRVFDRAFHPDGAARQLTAIQASGDRVDGLRALDMPTLVIHGEVDPLVHVEAGRRTAELIDGAELVLIDDMAHDLPRAHWDTYVDAIVANVARALEPTA